MMKSLFLVLGLTFIAGQLQAATGKELIEFASGTTFAPSVFTYSTYECVKAMKSQDPYDDMSCGLVTTLAPFTSSTIAAIVLLKEEIQQVEQDAYNFMAGESMSLALQELVEKARSENEELKDVSDKNLVSVLINSLEIH
jgi:hypothetical protein